MEVEDGEMERRAARAESRDGIVMFQLAVELWLTGLLAVERCFDNSERRTETPVS
jgi:hypothetical protein